MAKLSRMLTFKFVMIVLGTALVAIGATYFVWNREGLMPISSSFLLTDTATHACYLVIGSCLPVICQPSGCDPVTTTTVTVVTVLVVVGSGYKLLRNKRKPQTGGCI